MATRTKRLRILHEIYAELPSIECKGLCWSSCSHILVMPIETQNLELATGKAPATVEVDPLGTGELVSGGMPMLEPVSGTTGVRDQCPYLDEMRRCSVHAERPFICRVYGVGAGIPCPFGCRPTKVMPDHLVEGLMKRILRLG